MRKLKTYEPTEKELQSFAESFCEVKGFFYAHIQNRQLRKVGNKFVVIKADHNKSKPHKNNGFSDLIILGFSGQVLFLELKKLYRIKHKHGGLDEDQVLFRDYCEIMGHHYKVCYTTDEIERAINSLDA